MIYASASLPISKSASWQKHKLSPELISDHLADTVSEPDDVGGYAEYLQLWGVEYNLTSLKSYPRIV